MLLAIKTANQMTSHVDNFCARALPFSGVGGKIFRAFHSVHFYLLCLEHLERAEHYPCEFAAGTFLDITAGDRTWVRKAAQLILVSRIFLRCVEAENALIKSCRSLSEAFWNTYPPPTRYLQKKVAEEARLSKTHTSFASRVSSLPAPLFYLAIRLEIIALATFELLKQCFFLSRALLELYEAFIYDRYTELRAITGSLINAREIIETCMGSPRDLSHELSQNEQMVNRLLELIGSSYKTKTICRFIEESLPKIETAKKVIQEVASATRDIAATSLFFATGTMVVPPPLSVPITGQPTLRGIVEEKNDGDNLSLVTSCAESSWNEWGR
jgi:hypothetical protein